MKTWVLKLLVSNETMLRLRHHDDVNVRHIYSQVTQGSDFEKF